jgi:hypothetical protein
MGAKEEAFLAIGTLLVFVGAWAIFLVDCGVL